MALGLAGVFMWIKYQRRPNVDLDHIRLPRVVGVVRAKIFFVPLVL